MKLLLLLLPSIQIRTPPKNRDRLWEISSYDILKVATKKYIRQWIFRWKDSWVFKIKVIVDDKFRYTGWSIRDDIKVNLQIDLILLLDEYGYPPIMPDDVYKKVLVKAEISRNMLFKNSRIEITIMIFYNKVSDMEVPLN